MSLGRRGLQRRTTGGGAATHLSDDYMNIQTYMVKVDRQTKDRDRQTDRQTDR